MKITFYSIPYTGEGRYGHQVFMRERLSPGWDATEGDPVFTWTGDLPDENIEACIELIRTKMGLIATPEQLRPIFEKLGNESLVHETDTGVGDTVWRETVLDAVVQHLSAYDSWPTNSDLWDDQEGIYATEFFFKVLHMGAKIRGWKPAPEMVEDNDETS